MANPYHRPAGDEHGGEFTTANVGSKAFRDVINNPNAKSYEVAGANAKEQFKIRKEIDKALMDGDAKKVMRLQERYVQVQTVGKARHENMPVHGVMVNTSFKK